jgi:NADP-dependent 3-hydroxy acid dehydrogenase YdfG
MLCTFTWTMDCCTDSLASLRPMLLLAHVPPDIDMEDEAAGAKIIAGLPAGTHIDTLMHVAGYFTTETFDELNFSEERKMMEICAFAPLRITQSLVKANVLVSGSKVGMVTSEGGSVGLRTEEEGGANYGHHMSKCAQVGYCTSSLS